MKERRKHLSIMKLNSNEKLVNETAKKVEKFSNITCRLNKENKNLDFLLGSQR